MLRNVVAVLLGVFLGSALNMAIILTNMEIFPGPEGLNFNDAEAMSAYIGSLPQTAFILPMVAHLSQSLVGGWIAARFGESRPMLLAMIVGVLTLIGGILNFMQLPAPLWMYVEIPLYLVVAYGAGTIEVQRREGLTT